MERDDDLYIDGQCYNRTEVISLLEEHWEKLPQDIKNELLTLGICREKSN